ncbi:MAG: hypothetical protein FWD86_00735 [Firmicutes bacterium]|nr:hypothetical protein [Bacillota bacterium]
MNIKTKRWVGFVLKNGGKLRLLIECLDEKIEKSVLDLISPAAAVFDRTTQLIDKKRRIVNLFILYKALKRVLTSEEIDALCGRLDDFDTTEQGQEGQKSNNQVAIKTKKEALKKVKAVLVKMKSGKL